MSVLAAPPMKFVDPELGDITAEVYAELKAQIQRDHEQALREVAADQRAIAAATPGPARITKHFALKAQIDPRIVSYWRMREGPGFWKHELDNFLKKHPECRVEQKSNVFRAAAVPPSNRPRITGRGRWSAST